MIRSNALLFACLLIATGVQADVDDARAKGLAWLVQTQRGDGSYAGTKGLEVQATAAAVEAMINGGMTKAPHYARALSWLGNAPPGSLDAQAWQSLTLALAGRDAALIGAVIRDARNSNVAQSGGITAGNIATWGSYPGYGASVADTAMGYGALRSAGVAYTNDTTDLSVTVLCTILPAQLTSSPWSGAWPQALPQSAQPSSVTPGSLAATAAMLYEFKKQRQAGRFLSISACSKTSPSAIDTAMTSAKAWLIAQANADGGLAERNPQTGALEASNPSATALAVRTLALFSAEGDSAATTAVNNARAWLADQQATNGSWGGDPFVTARVLAALPVATGTQVADNDGDGLTDVVEVILGTQSAIADAQDQINHDGNSVPGLTATSFITNGFVNQTFSFNLNFVVGDSGPYTYTLAGGMLPPGITLAGDGSLSGTPTTVGSYAFDYQATEAGSGDTLIIGRIDIAADYQDDEDGDVVLPSGALVALLGPILNYVIGDDEPNTDTLSSGAQPPGITLAGAGALSGAPTAVGTATDAGSGETPVIDQIYIAAAYQDGEDGDVPLSAWALVLLGGALLKAMRRRVSRATT